MKYDISRRGALKAGGALVAASAIAPQLLQAQPSRGGDLRVGASGANTSDSWDARTHSDLFMQMACMGSVFDCLTEVAADGTLVGELAESWEPGSAEGDVWIFNLRQGVTFHNGKDFGPEDVIESLQLHVAEGAKSAAKPIVEQISNMEITGPNQVTLTLKGGNAGFPTMLADYHIVMYPAGMIEDAMLNGIGTGLFKVETFDPGVRFLGSRVEGHYKDGRAGWFNSIEMIAINDGTARMNALLTGQVDVINRIDVKTESLLKANPNIEIFEVTGNQHYTFPMLTNIAPFDDINVRKALKYSIDRQEMVDKILRGHGRVSYDNPIGPANTYFHDGLEPLTYDPDKAKFHLKQAGMDSLDVDLSTSDAAFVGAVDAAQLYQATAKAANININVIQEAADGYWSNVWLKKPWCACYWSGRSTEDWTFSTAYELGVPWNDTHWDNARFQELLLLGRKEIDPDKAREIYYEMQTLISQEGGTIVPMYANYVDAASTKLAHGPDLGNVYQMDTARIGERWWMA